MTRGLTIAEIGDLPAVLDLVTARKVLGLGRTKAYGLARTGQFSSPVIQVGKTYLVPHRRAAVQLYLGKRRDRVSSSIGSRLEPPN